MGSPRGFNNPYARAHLASWGIRRRRGRRCRRGRRGRDAAPLRLYAALCRGAIIAREGGAVDLLEAAAAAGGGDAVRAVADDEPAP